MAAKMLDISGNGLFCILSFSFCTRFMPISCPFHPEVAYLILYSPGSTLSFNDWNLPEIPFVSTFNFLIIP
jgi:hypothetical protein